MSVGTICIQSRILIEILTMLTVKLPYTAVLDNMKVTVDDGAKLNILYLTALTAMSIQCTRQPQPGFLEKCRTRLECYDDSKLIKHGDITLKFKHSH